MMLNPLSFSLFCPDKEEPTRADLEVVSEGMHRLPTAWVQPLDISNAVLFLASEKARFITAVTLPVAAGAVQH